MGSHQVGILKGGLYRPHMSYSLNSLKGGYIGDYIVDYYRAYEGGYYEFRL